MGDNPSYITSAGLVRLVETCHKLINYDNDLEDDDDFDDDGEVVEDGEDEDEYEPDYNSGND